MRIVIFSGTTEGRRLSRALAAMGAQVTVSVATDYGREEQGEFPGIAVRTGRLELPGMAELMAGTDLCIDATHPYAVQASGNIRGACRQANVPYRRLLRKESELPADGLCCDGAAEAAELLGSTRGNILLTTGAKELSVFAQLGGARLFPRVLPSAESLAACEEAGVPRANIIAMQGPFSRELNEALLRQFAIRYLVTKDGGAAGGFDEKIQAARNTGAVPVVIRRPRESGERYEIILQQCREMMGCE